MSILKTYFLLIVTLSITRLGQQSYVCPSLQYSYDYITSINPKYLIAGTVFGLATLAYIKKYFLIDDKQVLINEIRKAALKGDSTYFVPQQVIEQPGTVWANRLLKDTRHTVVNNNIMINKDDLGITIKYQPSAIVREFYTARWQRAPNNWDIRYGEK